jgi:immune inhibitor A
VRGKTLAAMTAAALVGALLNLPLTATEVGAQPSSSVTPRQQDSETTPSDNLVPKWRAKYDVLRQAALEKQLRGDVAVDREVVKLGKDRFSKVAQTGTDRIFVVLAEFGDKRHSAFCDSTDPEDCAFPSDGTPTRYDGPLHNQIPQPNRRVDNSTLWRKNYNKPYYEDLYYNRMAKFYEDQSSGAYSVEGDVTEWVKVPFNAARYGRNYCGYIICQSSEFLIRDALAIWVKKRLNSGQTMEQIKAYLKTFDRQDRYDYDEDGDFDEPDGYIDHFQIVHAGGDEADSDPIQATDAIWSHRGNVSIHKLGTGPKKGPQKGGVEVGEGGVSDPSGANVQLPNNPTGLWVSDYTMQPENGGLSVFAHEFAHDLGLPDLYDTSGNVGGATNSVGFWSLMGQSRGTAKADEGIGDQPMPFGAWEKFQLGWLDYKAIHAGRSGSVTLRPGQALSDRKFNGAVVVLPDKKVQLDLGDPCDSCGQRFFWSDRGDDLDTRMIRAVDDGGELTAKVKYSIEDGWDYAFLEASSDGGDTWKPVETSESYTGTDESGFNPSGLGISGTSDGWVDLTATVPDGTNAIRWRYLTDGAFALDGFQVDNITLDGELIGNAETEDEGWTFDGFRRTTGSDYVSYLNAYFVDNRQYVRRDRLLQHLYSYIGYPYKRYRKVEFYANEPGALVTYWDTSYSDNNVGDHPGHGELLVVDAHPEFDHYPSPEPLLVSPVKLGYDSPFSLKRSHDLHVRYLTQPYTIEGQGRAPAFNDRRNWWFTHDEHTVEGVHPGHNQPGWSSVDVPHVGVRIAVVNVAENLDLTIRVSPVRKK